MSQMSSMVTTRTTTYSLAFQGQYCGHTPGYITITGTLALVALASLTSVLYRL